MKRSIWKLPYIAKELFERRKLEAKRTLNLTKFRNSSIPFYLVGKKICISNGAWLLTKNIEESMVGMKVGEFSLSKRSDRQLQDKQRLKRQRTKKN